MSGKIFKGQSSLTVRANTGIDLSGSVECLIKYRKPDGSTGGFTGAVEDEAKGVIMYEVSEGDIDQAGWWVFWAYVEFVGGRSAPGEAVKVFVWDEGG